MTSGYLAAASWRRSSYSGEAGNCVEIGHLPGGTAIRDSKNPNEDALVLDARSWQALLTAVRSGELDPT
ncbi:MAG: DUF397 domain-containing protein [Thermocrispum sp.]